MIDLDRPVRRQVKPPRRRAPLAVVAALVLAGLAGEPAPVHTPPTTDELCRHLEAAEVNGGMALIEPTTGDTLVIISCPPH
ncbi:hypothetical protein FB565_008689 [Actinoplanes lutulentus]|uniref:hypothetical protein n=1 Tax=Actinoplanes lutulentus TaxID=1287878 RepID=UPI0011B939BF|nr:hypothetical protein [Actinoplanes lutulentus]MBB2948903.1 hypothetical protein [Actinoplanes lutulentus]